MLFGILIGVGVTVLAGLLAWLIYSNGQLRVRIQKMEKAMRKRLPYDGEKYAENTAAALVLLRHELETRLAAVDNAMSWNAKLLNLGIKPEREQCDDPDGR